MIIEKYVHLHEKTFDVEELDGETWRPYGKLHILPDVIVHNDGTLKGVRFHAPHNAFQFHGGEGADRKIGRLDFTQRGNAFVGMIETAEGSKLIRGATGYEEVFHTERCLAENPGDPLVKWKDFEIKTVWQDSDIGSPILVVTYLFGGTDVSDRVRVTRVNRKTGETTIEMVQSLDLMGDIDSFAITLPFGGQTFSGTYTDGDRTKYFWKGNLSAEQCQKRAITLQSAVEIAAAAVPAPLTRPMALYATNATLSLQDLDNVNSIMVVTDKDGKAFDVDQAQIKAGDYFNECLIKGLDPKWIKGIYGYENYSLNTNLQKLFDDHKSFFQNHSVLATGTMLKTCLHEDPVHGGVIQKISRDKLDAAWKAASSGEQSAPEYQTVTSALYIQGYHDGVDGIQAYIADGANKWGAAYYDYLTKPETILLWQIQLASNEFNDVKTRMYEWHTKLSVLAPDKDYAKDILAIAYSALLGVMYSKMRWSDDIKPFLLKVWDQALKGVINFADAAANQEAKDQQKILADMVSTSDIGLDVMDAMSDVLTFWQNKNPKLSLKDYFLKGNKLTEEIQPLLEKTNPEKAKTFSGWVKKVGQKAGSALFGLGYFAAAGFLIYTMASQSGQKVTVSQIAEDSNLGIVALAAGLKGIQKIFTLGVGSMIIRWAGENAEGFASFAKSIAQWFTEGTINASSKFGKSMMVIFGEDIGKFFGRRLGPVLAVFGVVMAGWFLVNAIKSGDVANIVFESLNTFMAVAVTIALGFEMFSFAWAGPVGIVIAVVGLIIGVIQLIYNLKHPPKPPKDTIEQFVEGPMTKQGLTIAA